MRDLLRADGLGGKVGGLDRGVTLASIPAGQETAEPDEIEARRVGQLRRSGGRFLYEARLLTRSGRTDPRRAGRADFPPATLRTSSLLRLCPWLGGYVTVTLRLRYGYGSKQVTGLRYGTGF